MKTIGVITEFNPFHKGHEYFLKTIRERSGADYVIAVMSGDFVQRGEPAIADKYVRTKMALHGGCDLVLELPVRFALGNAGRFAAGAVELLDALHVVDELWFGSESGEIEKIQSVAGILADEPPAFKDELSRRLRSGDSYPKARQAALSAVLGDSFSDAATGPNNVLGLEYCMAAFRLGSSMKLNTVSRTGGGYESSRLEGNYASALAIRTVLTGNDETVSSLRERLLTVRDHLPSYSMKLLEDEPGFLNADAFSELLKYRLMEETAESLAAYQDVSADLAKRIKNLENEYTGFSDFALKVKSKNYTYSHISRAFFSILFKLRFPVVPTAVRVLGMRECGELFRVLKDSSELELCTGGISMPALEYDRDLFASNLYESLKAVRFSTPFIHENSRKFIKI